MNMITRRILLASAGGLLPGRSRIRALVIDGINNHDWQAGTKAIVETLRAAGRFEVEISTTPKAGAAAGEWAAWRPDFARYGVVVNNFNGGHTAAGVRWPAAVEQALLRYVERGGGLVIFHAANNAFLEWPEYNEMIGLGWRGKAFGPGLIVDERERVVVAPAGEGLDPGHGPRHDFVVTTRDPRHPITDGFPKLWMHPAEQLTHGQHGPARTTRGALERELTILTYAWSKDSLRREPLDWVRRWGRGRIYTTMLGHTWAKEENPNVRCAGFRTMLARGAEWVATGRVSLAVPRAMPTAERVLLVESAPGD